MGGGGGQETEEGSQVGGMLRGTPIHKQVKRSGPMQHPPPQKNVMSHVVPLSCTPAVRMCPALSVLRCSVIYVRAQLTDAVPGWTRGFCSFADLGCTIMMLHPSLCALVCPDGARCPALCLQQDAASHVCTHHKLTSRVMSVWLLGAGGRLKLGGNS